MLKQQPLCQKYVDTIEQNALSRRVSGLSGGGGGGGGCTERNRSMVHRLDFDLRLRRLAADGGGSTAACIKLNLGLFCYI